MKRGENKKNTKRTKYIRKSVYKWIIWNELKPCKNRFRQLYNIEMNYVRHRTKKKHSFWANERKKTTTTYVHIAHGKIWLTLNVKISYDDDVVAALPSSKNVISSNIRSFMCFFSRYAFVHLLLIINIGFTFSFRFHIYPTNTRKIFCRFSRHGGKFASIKLAKNGRISNFCPQNFHEHTHTLREHEECFCAFSLLSNKIVIFLFDASCHHIMLYAFCVLSFYRPLRSGFVLVRKE